MTDRVGPAQSPLRSAVLSIAKEIGKPRVGVLAGAAVSMASGLPIANEFRARLAGSGGLRLPAETGPELNRIPVAFELLMDELRRVLSDEGRSSVAALLQGV